MDSLENFVRSLSAPLQGFKGILSSIDRIAEKAEVNSYIYFNKHG